MQMNRHTKSTIHTKMILENNQPVVKPYIFLNDDSSYKLNGLFEGNLLLCIIHKHTVNTQFLEKLSKIVN